MSDWDENLSTSKKYTIPKKNKEKDLLQEIQVSSREFQQDILPVLTHHYWHTDSKQQFQYTKCFLVQNDVLKRNFEEKRKEMRSRTHYTEKDCAISEAFLQSYSDDQTYDICKEGLEVGHTAQGSLGKATMGVYVSRQSDVFSSAPFAAGSSGSFIMFKILKGKVKPVTNQCHHLEPTPNCDSHVSKTLPSDLQKATPHQLFEALSVYLYEYKDTDVIPFPRNVLPFAVIHYNYLESPAERKKGLRDISKATSQRDFTLWSGIVKFGTKMIPNVQMVTNFSKLKPFSLGKILTIKRLVPFQSCLEWKPVVDLIQSSQGQLYKKRELRLASGQYATHTRLVLHGSGDTALAHMARKLLLRKAVGLSFLRGGTSVLVVPSSELSSQFGIPSMSDSARCLHCIFISYRSVTTGLSFTRDAYDYMEQPVVPPASIVKARSVMAIFAKNFAPPPPPPEVIQAAVAAMAIDQMTGSPSISSTAGRTPPDTAAGGSSDQQQQQSSSASVSDKRASEALLPTPHDHVAPKNTASVSADNAEDALGLENMATEADDDDDHTAVGEGHPITSPINTATSQAVSSSDAASAAIAQALPSVVPLFKDPRLMRRFQPSSSSPKDLPPPPPTPASGSMPPPATSLLDLPMPPVVEPHEPPAAAEKSLSTDYSYIDLDSVITLTDERLDQIKSAVEKKQKSAAAAGADASGNSLVTPNDATKDGLPVSPSSMPVDTAPTAPCINMGIPPEDLPNVPLPPEKGPSSGSSAKDTYRPPKIVPMEDTRERSRFRGSGLLPKPPSSEELPGSAQPSGGKDDGAVDVPAFARRSAPLPSGRNVHVPRERNTLLPGRPADENFPTAAKRPRLENDGDAEKMPSVPDPEVLTLSPPHSGAPTRKLGFGTSVEARGDVDMRQASSGSSGRHGSDNRLFRGGKESAANVYDPKSKKSHQGRDLQDEMLPFVHNIIENLHAIQNIATAKQAVPAAAPAPAQPTAPEAAPPAVTPPSPPTVEVTDEGPDSHGRLDEPDQEPTVSSTTPDQPGPSGTASSAGPSTAPVAQPSQAQPKEATLIERAEAAGGFASACGLLIPDDLVFIRANPEDVERVLETFKIWRDRGIATWTLKLHSQVVLQLAESKKNLQPTSPAHTRVTKLLVLLTKFRKLDVVDLLKKHECDSNSRPAVYYLPCVQKLKEEVKDTTFCVMLSNLNPDGENARKFADKEIFVMNIPTFIDVFIKQCPA